MRVTSNTQILTVIKCEKSRISRYLICPHGFFQLFFYKKKFWKQFNYILLFLTRLKKAFFLPILCLNVSHLEDGKKSDCAEKEFIFLVWKHFGLVDFWELGQQNDSRMAFVCGFYFQNKQPATQILTVTFLTSS